MLFKPPNSLGYTVLTVSPYINLTTYLPGINDLNAYFPLWSFPKSIFPTMLDKPIIGVSDCTVPEPVPFPIAFVPKLPIWFVPNSLHTNSFPSSNNSTNCTVTPSINVSEFSLKPFPIATFSPLTSLLSSHTVPDITLLWSSLRSIFNLIFGALSVSSSKFL